MRHEWATVATRARGGLAATAAGFVEERDRVARRGGPFLARAGVIGSPQYRGASTGLVCWIVPRRVRLETGSSWSWGPDSRKLRSSMPSGSVKLLGRVGRQLGCLLVVS